MENVDRTRVPSRYQHHHMAWNRERDRERPEHELQPWLGSSWPRMHNPSVQRRAARDESARLAVRAPSLERRGTRYTPRREVACRGRGTLAAGCTSVSSRHAAPHTLRARVGEKIHNHRQASGSHVGGCAAAAAACLAWDGLYCGLCEHVEALQVGGRGRMAKRRQRLALARIDNRP